MHSHPWCKDSMCRLLPKHDRAERIGPIERAPQHRAESAEGVLAGRRGRHGAAEVRAPRIARDLLCGVLDQDFERESDLREPTALLPLGCDLGLALPSVIDPVAAVSEEGLAVDRAVDVDRRLFR